jgi:hypothetical protein
MGNVQGPIQCVGGSECNEYQAEDISVLCTDDSPVNGMPLPGLTPLSIWESAEESKAEDFSAKDDTLLKLISSVRDDDPPRVLQLFVEGMDMNDMQQALSLAAKHGSVNVTRELVGIGCSVKFLDVTYGVTPLHLAACGGHPDICEILLDALADVNAECNGHTALSYARRLGNIEVQEVIEKQIAHPPHCTTPRETVNKRHLVLPRVSAILTEAVLLWDFSNEKKPPPSTNSADDIKSEFSYRSDTELISNVSTHVLNDLAHNPSSCSPGTSAASDGTAPEGGEFVSPQTSSRESVQQGSEHSAERSDAEPKQDLADLQDCKDEVSPTESSSVERDCTDEAVEPSRLDDSSTRNDPVVDHAI